jgi:cobyrinic acid a,c-diamide synthase
MSRGARPRGLMIAAPQSGSGKTVVTLALLRTLRNRGCSIRAAKAGPDFIDPGFHKAAVGLESANLDPWAMSRASITTRAGRQCESHLLIEGMMGLFDGAADGSGSSADLAATLGVPVLMVIDAARQSHSIAALARGFREHREDVQVCGVILNRVASARHQALLRAALGSIEMPVWGCVPRDTALQLPERHLGLVQAAEHDGLEKFIARAADIIVGGCDIDAIIARFAPMAAPKSEETAPAPIGSRIAVARDAAFSFIYPHLLSGWRDAGAQISFFSPLADQAPPHHCDSIFLPGGYPELHAGKLAAAENFKQGLKKAASDGKIIYGECGGYMVLGAGIEDATGCRYAMCGLLGVETSFARRKLHLGYRRLKGVKGLFDGAELTAHEFHYTTTLRETGEPLFSACDSAGKPLGRSGLRDENVMGSFMHVIDRAGS